MSAHIDALLGPAGPEVGCEECFDWLDAYVELDLAGADVDAAFAGMCTHLEGCPACREEHVNLLMVGGFGDIALRGFGLLLGALTLAPLAQCSRWRPVVAARPLSDCIAGWPSTPP